MGNNQSGSEELFEAFSEYIATEKLFTSADRLLLAVSGGVDSVVLCELCMRAGYDIVIVHCNFQLRGEESLRDEAFVRELAAKYGRPVAIQRFDTAAYAAANKVSIQVAARQLRYDWFYQFMKEGDVRYIVTAHHLDDNIETLAMNFFKGTGIAGMRAMLPSQSSIVRPLLFAGRSAILQYAADRGLSWVEDSSNQSEKYTRNYFRHAVLPLLEQVYPGALGNLADNIGRFREIETIYRRAIDEQKKKLLEYRGIEVYIPVLKLLRSEPLRTLLYEIITPYGFTPHQVDAVRDLLGSGSGRYVASPTYRILKDRNWLIISPIAPVLSDHILLEGAPGEMVFPQGKLQWKVVDVGAVNTLDQGPNIALLDASHIQFPLLLRRWRAGDYFYPLGMRKKKKLARFFIDNKRSIAEKEKVWVLEMDKKIVWVVGQRIDDRWRLGPGTRQVLRIEWEPR